MLRKLGLGVSACVLAVLPAVAAGVPAVSGEFDVAEAPGELAPGPDGNMWVVLTGGADDVARIAPDGTVTPFAAANITGAVSITAGPDGRMWVTQAAGVAHFAPADPTNATVIPVQAIADNGARGITSGPDGNLWAATGGDKVVRITPGGTPTPFTVPGMGGRGITSGSDGNLYIADFGSARIVGLTPAGVPTFHPTGGGPQEVEAGPDGQVAFTNQGASPHQLGRFSAGGAVAGTDVPNTDPFGIALGADGAYWVANFLSGDLTRFTTEGAVTSLGGLSADSGPRHVASGPGNTLWVSLETAKRVARITGVEPGPAPPTDGGGTAPVTPPPTGDPAPLIPPPGMTRPNAPRSVRVGRAIPVTTTFTQKATLLVRVHRILPGKRAARRCVAPRPALRKARGCVRYALLGSFARSRSAGAVRVAVGPRIGRKRLNVGRYRIGLRARSAAGLVSPWRTVVVRVVR
jgi:streptogramin lyase